MVFSCTPDEQKGSIRVSTIPYVRMVTYSVSSIPKTSEVLVCQKRGPLVIATITHEANTWNELKGRVVRVRPK